MERSGCADQPIARIHDFLGAVRRIQAGIPTRKPGFRCRAFPSVSVAVALAFPAAIDGRRQAQVPPQHPRRLGDRGAAPHPVAKACRWPALAVRGRSSHGGGRRRAALPIRKGLVLFVLRRSRPQTSGNLAEAGTRRISAFPPTANRSGVPRDGLRQLSRRAAAGWLVPRRRGPAAARASMISRASRNRVRAQCRRSAIPDAGAISGRVGRRVEAPGFRKGYIDETGSRLRRAAARKRHGRRKRHARIRSRFR